MQTILITGGAGFIGSNLIKKLIKDNLIVCVDNFNDYYSPEYKRENIAEFLNNKNFVLYEKDLSTKMLDVFTENKIDKIIHLGARAGVRPSLQNPGLYYKVNFFGTLNLLWLAHHTGVKQFIFASSSSVYGENSIPFSEDDRIESQISPYALSKKFGEDLCRYYSQTSGINFTCLRFFTVYGERGRPDMFPYLATKAILNNEPINMFGDGSSLRDYTYIDDITDGIVRALEKEFKFKIFNLGGSVPIKLSDFIKTIEKITGKTAKINKMPMSKGDVKATYADIGQAIKWLRWRPKTDLETGMTKFINWYKKERYDKEKKDRK